MTQAPVEFLKYFRCPTCKGKLAVESAALRCPACETNYSYSPRCVGFIAQMGDLPVESQKEHAAREKEAEEYDRQQVASKGASFALLQERLIRDSISGVPAGPVLDGGCGTGWMTQRWVDFGREIFALDFNLTSLKILERRKLPNVMGVHGDMTALPFGDESFAIQISHLVLQHIPDSIHEKVYRELFRTLAPGGVLVVTAYNSAKFRGLGWPKRGEFESGIPYFSSTAAEMRDRAIAAGFRDVEVRPMGRFLYWQNLKIRGSLRAYRVLSPFLNWLEVKLFRMSSPNRERNSEYWIMSAKKMSGRSALSSI